MAYRRQILLKASAHCHIGKAVCPGRRVSPLFLFGIDRVFLSFHTFSLICCLLFPFRLHVKHADTCRYLPAFHFSHNPLLLHAQLLSAASTVQLCVASSLSSFLLLPPLFLRLVLFSIVLSIVCPLSRHLAHGKRAAECEAILVRVWLL